MLSNQRKSSLVFLIVPVAVMATALPANAQAQGAAGEASADVDEPAARDGQDAPTGARSEKQLSEARLHFSNGVELLQAQNPNYQDAYRQFMLAYQKSGQNWKILGNLAFSALKLERDGEALEYYQRYLEQGRDEIEESERSDIQRELLLIKGNMAQVTLSSDNGQPMRITVERNGSSVPPQLYEVDGSEELGLRAGALTITATQDGVSRSWETVVSPEETTSHTFDFSEQAPTETKGEMDLGASPPPKPGPDKSGPKPLVTAGYVTAGVGLAGVVGGVITGVLKESEESSARDNDCIGSVCRQGAFDSAETLATVTNVLFIGGGVLTAAGVTLVVVGSKSDTGEVASPRLELLPVGGPGAAGVFASGHF